jgi:hypothetical protein
LTQRACPSVDAYSRRGVIRAALTSAAGALIAAPALAREKMSRAEAQYQDRPTNGLSCAACSLYRPPDGCVVVAGPVSPHGWCRFFDLPD